MYCCHAGHGRSSAKIEQLLVLLKAIRSRNSGQLPGNRSFSGKVELKDLTVEVEEDSCVALEGAPLDSKKSIVKMERDSILKLERNSIVKVEDVDASAPAVPQALHVVPQFVPQQERPDNGLLGSNGGTCGARGIDPSCEPDESTEPEKAIVFSQWTRMLDLVEDAMHQHG